MLGAHYRPCRLLEMQQIDLTLFADYFQFYIQDDDESVGDLSDAWTPEATDRMLAVSDGVIGVGTARNMDVAVRVYMVEKLPVTDEGEWDRLNSTAIECRTGRFVIAGCTDYFPEARRIPAAPGIYDVLIGYKDLDKLSEDRLDGEDSYHLFLARRE